MNSKNSKETQKEPTATEKLLNKYPEELVKNVRENLGLTADNTDMDGEILDMNHAEFLDRVLTWNGLVGYGNAIRKWVGDVYGTVIGTDDVSFETTELGRVVYRG